MKFNLASTRIASILLLVFLGGTTASRAEDWPGYTGGNLHHNASEVDIPPAGIGRLWQHSFMAVPFGYQKPPARTSGCRGSLNLVKSGSYMALIANDTREHSEASIVILNTARNGETVNNFNIQCHKNDGDYSNLFYPTGIQQISSDVGRGQQLLAWDTKTGILYINTGGDGIYACAYKPLENLQSFKGKLQRGVPAFEGIPRKWLTGTDRPKDFMAPKDPANPDAPDPDLWFTWDKNSTAYYEIDPDLPLMAITKKNHEQRGWPYFVNKQSGLFIPGSSNSRYDTPETEPQPINKPPYTVPIKHLNPFGAMGGLRLANGRLFMMGPSDDNNGDGELGDTALVCGAMTVEAEASAKLRTTQQAAGTRDRADDPDQGLYIWACKVSMEKSGTGNGALPGDAGVDRVKLDKTFVYRFPSDHKPIHGPADADSYLETDFYYRKKAWLVDGSGVWAAWKPGIGRGVELIHADDSGALKFDLQVAKGLRGQDIWPHLSLTVVNQRKYLVYYFGNALRREVMGEKPFSALATFARETSVPAGPAELAVFDATAEKVSYTFNMTAAFPSLQPNDEWRYYDRSQMVVAGKYAWVAWVDHTKPEATLHMACFDITAAQANPVETMIPLGFPSANNRRSNVTDLSAADGQLYALVTQSDLLGPNDPTWDAQHVVCVGPVARGTAPAESGGPPPANKFKPVYPKESIYAKLPPFLEKILRNEILGYVRSVNENLGDYRAQAIVDGIYDQYMYEVPGAFDFTPGELKSMESGKPLVDEEDVIKAYEELRKKTQGKMHFLDYQKSLLDKGKLNAVQTTLFHKIIIEKMPKAKAGSAEKSGKPVSETPPEKGATTL